MTSAWERPRPPFGWRDITRIVAGGICIVLGVIGLVLPFLQGILLLAIGTGLLAPYIPFFRRLRIWFYRRYPEIRRRLHKKG